MNVVKLVVSISFSLVFVISTVTVLFSAGGILDAALKTYVFEVDNCYGPRPIPLDEEGEKPEAKCEVDYNDAKREIAGGLAYLIVAAPLAYFTFKKSQSLIKEGRA